MFSTKKKREEKKRLAKTKIRLLCIHLTYSTNLENIVATSKLDSKQLVRLDNFLKNHQC